MTDNNHPITPPDELIAQWGKEAPRFRDAGLTREHYMTTQAARWGADQELEACCEWVEAYAECGGVLRAARRPKPASLKEQALETIVEMANCMKAGFIPIRSDLDIIRRAIESLPD